MVKKLLLGLVIAALTACGGGSSGGAGGGSGPTTGTFGGTFTITLASGVDSVVESGPILMVVQPDGTVIRDPGTDGSFTHNQITIPFNQCRVSHQHPSDIRNRIALPWVAFERNSEIAGSGLSAHLRGQGKQPHSEHNQ